MDILRSLLGPLFMRLLKVFLGLFEESFRTLMRLPKVLWDPFEDSFWNLRGPLLNPKSPWRTNWTQNSYLSNNWVCEMIRKVPSLAVFNEEILSQSLSSLEVPKDPVFFLQFIICILNFELWELIFDVKSSDDLNPLKVEFKAACFVVCYLDLISIAGGGGFCIVDTEKVRRTTQIHQEEQIVHLVRMLSPSLWH